MNVAFPNSWMVHFMEQPIKMDDNLGYPYFRKPPYSYIKLYHLYPAHQIVSQLDFLGPHLGP